MSEKRSILTELIKLAKIDNEYREEEYQFLLTISKMLSVSKKEFDLLFDNYADFVPPKLETQRIVQFQRLVMVANVDLEVDSKELDILRRSGLKLGLNTNAVESVLKEMKRHPGGNIPANILIKIFQVYHN